MNAQENKRLIESVYAALAEGDAHPFVDAMADDFTWIISGEHPWSGTWRGKQVVREGLLGPLVAQFATTYRARATRLIADEDTVAVECRGDVMTTSGRPYRNQYCNLIRLRDGRMVELVEYMDSHLCLEVLAPPPTRNASAAS